jgi:opine dehydrogenase
VVRLIEAVDGELLALRETLGTSDHRRYRDFLIAQGLAPDIGDLYAVMRAGGITRSVRPSGSREALVDRLALEVPYSLVFASSLGNALGVNTPVIDGLIALSAVILSQDVWAEGRTLQRLGLSGLGAAEMRAYAVTGSYPTD